MKSPKSPSHPLRRPLLGASVAAGLAVACATAPKPAEQPAPPPGAQQPAATEKSLAMTTIQRVPIPLIDHQLTPEQIGGLLPYVNTRLWDEWMKENGALERSFDRPYRQ